MIYTKILRGPTVEEEQIYREERLKIKHKNETSLELIFLKRCPYFLNCCKATNWSPCSPCYKCLAEGKYNKNAENIDCYKLKIGNVKCR